jgi:hypothetical protein
MTGRRFLSEAGLGAAICMESFLREKGVEDVPRKRTDFGKAVLRVWRERRPAHDPPKKQVFVNGQEILANSYWEEHRDVLEEAYRGSQVGAKVHYMLFRRECEPYVWGAV